MVTESQDTKPPIVVKISGSLIAPGLSEEAQINKSISFLKRFTKNIKKISNYYRISVVVGGGSLSRAYIKILKNIVNNMSMLDLVGITASRLNAQLISYALYPLTSGRIVTNVEEVLEEYSRGLIPVSGGWEPGHSTNAVALIIAEALGAKTVYNLLSRYDGVYYPNPEAPNARLLEEATYDQLEKIIKGNPQAPGRYELLDQMALEIAKRSRIRIHFLHGDPDLLARVVIEGERAGTIVHP